MDSARLRSIIDEQTSDYVERLPGSSKRLRRALEVIILAYYSSVVSSYSEDRFAALTEV